MAVFHIARKVSNGYPVLLPAGHIKQSTRNPPSLSGYSVGRTGFPWRSILWTSVLRMNAYNGALLSTHCARHYRTCTNHTQLGNVLADILDCGPFSPSLQVKLVSSGRSQLSVISAAEPPSNELPRLGSLQHTLVQHITRDR